MGLIRNLEESNEARQLAVTSASPSVRQASASRAPFSCPPLDDLDGLIPETIAEVVLGKTGPETAFAELRGMPAEERPGVLFVDARDTAPRDIRAWLDKFDALVYEQDEAGIPDPVDLQVVMFLDAKLSLEPFDDLLTRSDVDWVLTDNRVSPLKDLYQDLVRKDLTALLSTDPTDGLEQADDPDARPIEDFLPEDELEAWKQRLRDLGHQEG